MTLKNNIQTLYYNFKNNSAKNKNYKKKILVIQLQFLVMFLFYSNWVDFNLYLTLLAYLFWLPFYSIMPPLLLIVCDKKDSIILWQNADEKLLRFLREKIRISMISALKFFIFNVLLFAVYKLTGLAHFFVNFRASQLNTPITNFVPNWYEGLLILAISVLLIIASINMIYWIIFRFIKIKQFNQETQQFKLKSLKINSGLISVLLLCAPISLTLFTFGQVVQDNNINGFSFLSPSNAYIIFIIEFLYLIIINLLIFYDWKYRIKFEEKHFVMDENVKITAKF